MDHGIPYTFLLSLCCTYQHLTYYVVYSIIYKLTPLIRLYDAIKFEKTAITPELKAVLDILAVSNNLWNDVEKIL